MVDYGHYGAPTGRSSGLGIASLVCGLLALAVAWIPFCGLLPAMLLGVVGAVLGLVGLFASGGGVGIGFPLAGLLVSILALIVGLVFTFGFAAAVGSNMPSRPMTTRAATQPARTDTAR